MNLVLAAFTAPDATNVVPALPTLRRHATVHFVDGYMNPAAANGIDEIHVPPRPGSRACTRREEAIARATDDAEDRAFAAAWLDELPTFFERTFTRLAADAVIVTSKDIESTIAADAARRAGIPRVCVLTPFHEFKYDALFVPHDAPVPYLVAGAFGRERVERRGVPSSDVHVVGNPRFDSLLLGSNGPSPHEDPRPIPERHVVLVASQGLPENRTLWDRLVRYAIHRPDVELVLRVHPALGSGAVAEAEAMVARARFATGGRVSVSRRDLHADLRAASALVAFTSMVILDALVLSVPVVLWSPDGLPARVPFGRDGHALVARHGGELSAHLDALAPGSPFRESWVRARVGAHVRYLGDGPATPRFVETLLAVCERGRSS
ncbi:MAG: hypothetical protein U0169_23910 [Polyangiaceae bacterium]